MELELATQAGDMVVAQEKKMEIIKEDVERDIRSQLRRQAAVHSDHLQDGGVWTVKYVESSLLVTSLGVGGTIGYAGVDDQFRMSVEESVPGADEVMEMHLGKRTPVETVSDVPKLKIGSVVVATHPGKEVGKSPPLSVPPPSQPVLDILSEEEDPVAGADLVLKVEEEAVMEAPALVDKIKEEKVVPSQLELEVPPPVIEESVTPEVVPTEADEADGQDVEFENVASGGWGREANIAWLPVSALDCRAWDDDCIAGVVEPAVLEVFSYERIQPTLDQVLLLSNDVEKNPGPPR